MGKLFDELPDGYLKKVLEGEDPEVVERLLTLQMKYKTAKDKEDRAVYKDRLTGAYWQLYIEIAKKMTPNSSKPKRLMVRYGLLDMKYLNQEDQKLVLSQPFDKEDEEKTLYYMDEWLIKVGQGEIKPSMTDETPKRNRKKDDSSGGVDPGIQARYERLAGAADAEKINYQNLISERSMKEDALTSLIGMVTGHSEDPMLGLPDAYTEDQQSKLDEVSDIVRELKRLDKQLQSTKNGFHGKFQEVQELERQLGQQSDSPIEKYEVDSTTLENEAGALRQMIKMCVGRQGNHFPILASAYLPKETREYNFKDNIHNFIADIEKLDPSVFERAYRQQTNRIPPYIILVPGYGNMGICWEPYDKYNKATSKGRLAIPIFCRNPATTLSMALGDFRWQTAKELASYHWMDEGLTGRYYEYTQTNKLKGDIKSMFIEDYILWLTKEAEGIQKLHKDSRYIFWRFVPFPDDLKEKLSLKGYYYDQLWKKEQSFRLSQGY